MSKKEKNPFPLLIIFCFGIAFVGAIILGDVSYIAKGTEHSLLKRSSVEIRKGLELELIEEYRWIWERKPKTVVDIIKQVAKEKGFKNVDLLIRIAECESGLRTDVRGVVDKRDRGLFQINSRWNPDVPDYIAFNAKSSTEWAISEINKGNLWKWENSKFCWNK